MRRKRMPAAAVLIPFLGGAAMSPFAGPARAEGKSEALYKTKCAACHGADGKGETAIGKANKLRDFSSPDVQKQSDDELSAFIANGKGKMPAYGRSLKPEQIRDLVGYLRTFKK